MIIYGGKTLSQGLQKCEVVSGDIWAFNIPTSSWVEIINQSLKPRFNHQIISNQNELIIFGGENKETFLDGELKFFKVNKEIWVD